MKKLLLVLGIFFLVYYPPVLGFHSLRILAFISVVYLFLNIRKLHTLFNTRRILNTYLVWIGILVWMAAVVILNGQAFGSLNAFVYWLIAVIPASLMIGAEIRKSGGELDTLIDLVLNAGMLQGILAVASFFLPFVKQYFLNRLSAAEVLDLEYYGYYVDMRLYGYSNGLTYAMPVIQAILAMVAIYLAINKSLKYLIYVPFLMFSAIINGRTPIIIVAICALVLLFQRLTINPRKAIRIFLLLAGVIVVVVFGLVILNKYAYYTFLWIQDGAKQITGFFKGDFSEGYFSYLMDPAKWILPGGFSVLFGTGARIMGENPTGVVSDIGYVNDIWLGGLLYCVVAYCLVCSYIHKFRKHPATDTSQQMLVKYLSRCLLLCAVFLNLKGYVINLNCVANFFVLIAVFRLITKSQDPDLLVSLLKG